MAALTFTADDLAIAMPDYSVEERTQIAEDALALALLAAPCLAAVALSELQVSQVRAVLRGAVQRWSSATAPSFQIHAGDFGIGPGAQPSNEAKRSLFFSTEEDKLRDICASGSAKRAHSGWTI